MFRKNEDYKQEKLNSTVKNLPTKAKDLLYNNWPAVFYEHVFSKIDEDKFAELYSDEYSRPNKPVNELVSLDILKEWFDWNDETLIEKYYLDLSVNYAIGKENLGEDILAEKTLNNFRRRLVIYEKETGISLMKEVFKDIRDDLMEEFKIDGSTQRMDSTFIQANIKNLTRLDLFVRVLHNFLNDLSENELENIPDEIRKFRDGENLNLTYRLKRKDVEEKLDELAEFTAWIKDRFEDDEKYNMLKSFEHICRVLDEQCYRIIELEDDEKYQEENEDEEELMWEPAKKFRGSNDDSDDCEEEKNVELKEPKDVHSGSLQNPHDDEATYREKNGESYQGYKSNWCETCSKDNPFQIITEVDVDTNNTEDVQMLEGSIEYLSEKTNLEDIINDAGYSGKDIEEKCGENGVTQHFSGIKGRQIEDERIPLGETVFDEYLMVECPEGHQPYRQEYYSNKQRYWGRFKKETCDNCKLKEQCFVVERIGFYSYGFYHRQRITAERRVLMRDPEYRKLLQLRAGAESMINEVYHKTGKRTRYTGKIKVKNSTIAKGVGVNIKRVTRFLKKNSKMNVCSNKSLY